MNKVILLADDSEDDIIEFKRVLVQTKVLNPIAEVHTGAEVISYLKGEGAYGNRNTFPYPVIIFLDLLMPGDDGWEVLNWLKANPGKKTMLVVVLTGVGQRNKLREAYLSGANSFLMKPFNQDELETLIAAYPNLWMFPQGDPRTPPLPDPNDPYKRR